MELSPRTAPGRAGCGRPQTPPQPLGLRRARRSSSSGIGVVAYQALSSASLYFYNADEAVAQKADLGDQRFRLQGSVLDDVEPSRRRTGVTFTVTFNGVEVPVHHEGDPPELFEPGIPVVLEGRWASSGEVFESDRILVKHSRAVRGRQR